MPNSGVNTSTGSWTGEISKLVATGFPSKAVVLLSTMLMFLDELGSIVLLKQNAPINNKDIVSDNAK
ncbi:hypothetical protein GCM10011364_22400 [Mangrovimonas yunxiaonensis]|nr:hypothetical protein GCM10011364_22400 [Mangrovimonas yunxiaonensis]